MCTVIPFPAALRTQQIAGQYSASNGNGPSATQAFQREAVRYAERNRVLPAVAASHVVRGKRETLGDVA